MLNKLLLVGVGILVLGVIGWKLMPVQTKEEVSETQTGTQEVKLLPKNRPTPPVKGDKLADSAVAPFAFQVYPGELSVDAKTALIGFDIQTTPNPDGSAIVVFTPKNQDDQKQTFQVPAGQTLYFVEMSKGDDDADSGTDSNLRDDYGVLVDSNGIVQ
jgi:hypothetical protein